MDWADELAASVQGPQVVNDSKTPSGTVHVGSLRGPVILDVITRALRARGLETTLLYGVDDMDPMDAQALLTPGRHRALHGRPARPDPRPGRRLPRLVRPASRPDVHRPVLGPRDPPRPLLLDERHLPDRARWTPTSGRRSTGPPSCATSTVASRTSSTPTTGCRSASSARTAAGSARRSPSDWDGETVAVACRPDLVAWATGCGWTGPDRAVRRRREAALEPRVGRAVEPVRRHDRAQRQGPRDRGRVTRPVERDRARGLRARAAAQLPLRVPQHRRPEDVDLEGPGAPPRTGSPRSSRRSRRGSCSSGHRPESAIEFDPEGTDAVPRLFDEFDRLGAATAGREVKGELPSGFDSIFRYSLLDPGGGRRRGRGRVPARRSRTSRCSSRSRAWTSTRASSPRRAPR